ncbi:MAG: hypothetical protein JXA25_01685 [Anaerolineales bacterium]|nr:hypothetical protein [Anaerolineales bacterium]
MKEQEAIEAVAEFIDNKGERIFFVRNLISAVISAAVLALMGLFFLFIFSADTSVHCERTEADMVNCMLLQTWFGLIDREKGPVTGLEGAWIEENYDSEDDSTTYRVVLDSQRGDIPLTSAFSSGYQGKADLVLQINQFLSNVGENELDISTGTPVLPMLIGVVLLLSSPALLIGMLLRKGRPFGQQNHIQLSKMVNPDKQDKKDNSFWD